METSAIVPIICNDSVGELDLSNGQILTLQVRLCARSFRAHVLQMLASGT